MDQQSIGQIPGVDDVKPKRVMNSQHSGILPQRPGWDADAGAPLRDHSIDGGSGPDRPLTAGRG